MDFRTVYRVAYEISPIILVDGIAAGIPFKMLPIALITEVTNLARGAITSSLPTSLDEMFAHYIVQSGGTMVDQAIGKYPFANQQIAANAVITNPLTVSIKMVCPPRQPGSMVTKLASLEVLKLALDKHTALGGSYHVFTPGQLYMNCLLTSLRDVTSDSAIHKQSEWLFEFEKPLVTIDDAVNNMNALMSRFTKGTPA